MSPGRKKETGGKGEQLAAQYLRNHGYTILHTNWRCRSGEIDIVAQKGGAIVFVEVRTRTAGGGFGSPEESVDARKQVKVRQTAQMYLYAHKQFNAPARFDVIGVELTPAGELADLRHIENAFV
ncbi:MAG TPA: YraN family protein [Bacilli bacterium]